MAYQERTDDELRQAYQDWFSSLDEDKKDLDLIRPDIYHICTPIVILIRNGWVLHKRF